MTILMDGVIENINLYKIIVFFHNLKPKEIPKKGILNKDNKDNKKYKYIFFT